MTMQTEDIRIASVQEVSMPAEVQQELPQSETGKQTVLTARAQLQAVMNGEDDRLAVVVGPCSIHDIDAALEYADKLQAVRSELADDLLIIMRVYFEKPRTTVGWKGLINDPGIDDSFEINRGLRLARNLLQQLADRGLPAGTEFLDLLSPQYVTDLISWGAIGARTTESQCHRELASGLSCPVGFKNGTGGNVQIAVDAVGSATRAHHFLGMNKQGRNCIFKTAGNADTHIIMRGGTAPNYDANSVEEACLRLERANLPVRVMIDCSHANSNKQPERQVDVGRDIAEQIAAGDRRIFGVMIESHLVGGNQKPEPGAELRYGQSITDGCLGFDKTEVLLGDLAAAVQKRREAKP